MWGRWILAEDSMVQADQECWKRRGTLEETVNIRREAKEAQGSEGARRKGQG